MDKTRWENKTNFHKWPKSDKDRVVCENCDVIRKTNWNLGSSSRLYLIYIYNMEAERHLEEKSDRDRENPYSGDYGEYYTTSAIECTGVKNDFVKDGLEYWDYRGILENKK